MKPNEQAEKFFVKFLELNFYGSYSKVSGDMEGGIETFRHQANALKFTDEAFAKAIEILEQGEKKYRYNHRDEHCYLYTTGLLVRITKPRHDRLKKLWQIDIKFTSPESRLYGTDMRLAGFDNSFKGDNKNV